MPAVKLPQVSLRRLRKQQHWLLGALALVVLGLQAGAHGCGPVGDVPVGPGPGGNVSDAGSSGGTGAGGQGGSASGAQGGAGAAGGASAGAAATSSGAQGGAAGSGGRTPLVWEQFTELAGCQLEQVTNIDAADSFFEWEPCGNEVGCEVARPHFEDLGSERPALLPGSSVGEGGGIRMALAMFIGERTHALLVGEDGRLLQAIRTDAVEGCWVTGTALTATEFGMNAGHRASNASWSFGTLRWGFGSGRITAQADVSGLHSSATPYFHPHTLTQNDWLISLAATDIATVDRAGVAREVVPEPGAAVGGRSVPELLGDGRILFGELRVGVPGDEGNENWTISIADRQSPAQNLIAVGGQSWASPRWTGDGIALLRGYNLIRDYNVFERTEVWAGVVPEDPSQFAPVLIGAHARDGVVNVALGEAAIGGHGYYIVALPATLDVPGGLMGYRAFAIWDLKAKSKRVVTLEQGEALSPFLGVTATHVYALINDNSVAVRIKRFKLQVE